MFVAEIARILQSVLDEKTCCSYAVVVVARSVSPILFVVCVVTAVTCAAACVDASISLICCRWMDGAEISIPRMISRISELVSDAVLTARGRRSIRTCGRTGRGRGTHHFAWRSR